MDLFETVNKNAPEGKTPLKLSADHPLREHLARIESEDPGKNAFRLYQSDWFYPSIKKMENRSYSLSRSLTEILNDRELTSLMSFQLLQEDSRYRQIIDQYFPIATGAGGAALGISLHGAKAGFRSLLLKRRGAPKTTRADFINQLIQGAGFGFATFFAVGMGIGKKSDSLDTALEVYLHNPSFFLEGGDFYYSLLKIKQWNSENRGQLHDPYPELEPLIERFRDNMKNKASLPDSLPSGRSY